ncbi:MAG: MerR family transcriptional regulator [Bacillota bacterium]
MAIKYGFRVCGVARLTGLTCGQLDYWDRTGFIRPSLAPAAGRGSARLYSFQDVVLRVAKELRGAGVALQRLRKGFCFSGKKGD